MNAAAAARLDAILRSAGGAAVEVSLVQIQEFPMSPGLVRQRVESARVVEVHDEGLGVLQPDGSWLWINQPGGKRA